MTNYSDMSKGELISLLNKRNAPDVQGEPVGWQFYQHGEWWNGDDRIKDHRKNTKEAGFRVRDVYAAPQPEEQQPAPALSKFLEKEEWNDAFAQGFDAGFNSDERPAPDVADCEQVLDDHRRLTRELDVLLNGEEGAAQQASLCDLVAQLRTVVKDTGKPILAAPDVSQLVDALEQVIKSAPSGGPLWHGSEQIVEARAALAAHQKQETSHDNQ